MLRKGRFASYEFKMFKDAKAKVLFEKMRMKYSVPTGNIMLADIYNVNEAGSEYTNSNKPKIGFVKIND